MMYKERPEDFHPKFEVACCHVDCGGKFLMLHRADHKSAGDTWGVPAGKVEPGESILETAQRETKEETGIDIPIEDIHFCHTVFIRYPDYDFVYHIFQAEIKNESEVVINESEHKDFRWVAPEEALKRHLVPDEDACIKLVYGESEKQEVAKGFRLS